MPDFTRPEYASYVELCRSLRLQREWQEGDVLWASRGFKGEAIYRIGESVDDMYSAEIGYGIDVEGAWLPQLSDWLDMLEAAGYHEAAFFKLGKKYYARAIANSRHAPSGRTREEAAARLAIAVGAVKAP